MKFFQLVFFMVSLPCLAWGQAGIGVITGYGVADCAERGEIMTISGMNFRDDPKNRRVVMHAPGVDVQLTVIIWQDHEIRVRVPDDPRLKPDQIYEIRLEVLGRGLQQPVLGPPLRVCAAVEEPSPREEGIRVPPSDPVAAARLVEQVMRASGGEAWPRVNRVRFTFNISEGQRLKLSAKHDWDVRAGTDTVEWGGKQVTVRLDQPPADAEGQAAYRRWVNDSYWLLAPLKLKDPGVTVEYGGRGTIHGRDYLQLKISFDGVGLTPQDRYHFYIDPTDSLVRRWDYLPANGAKVSGTWEDYREFGGLRLATDHQFNGRRIWFTEIEVTTDEE